ncbi:uncharacterized protein BHQ10_003470 [Talaromyces amestolkiae]|uniref:Mid2 domain-containing protein n=1 Tax=Talaromyces amestolkiae TaxID=1196081 RepID=A0A364KV83_TALAM|nr:uncharacterized protein BHQ10_003470 [Talaromyces amestolkiae]RAO67458.1 hypothetical protein BHQ10_003470 [Talaromyces amestolkiae]
MASVLTTILLWLATLSVLVVARVPAYAALRTRNSPKVSDADTLDIVGRALQHARLQSRDSKYSMNRTSLAKSWVGTTLFKYSQDSSNETTAGSHTFSSESSTDIEIICTTCYVNGSVTGDLTLTGDYNFTAAVEGVKTELQNVTYTAVDQFEEYIEELGKDITNEIETFNATTLPAWPTLDVGFDLENNTGLPGASIHFEFDDLELYLELDIKLSAEATYTLNLYTSETPEGISVPGVTIGAVFSIDLILIANAEIDIGSGIHIKLDDGLAFDLEMFNSNVSTVTIPGGAYEFLPVTISGEGSIQALLSLKASLGVHVNLPDTSAFTFAFDAGIESDVFAYVADFLMQVNGSTTADDDDCKLAAVAEYTFAVGAAAGATLAIDQSHSWGPSPDTTIPVWYTTLASICAATKTVASTAASVITARAELGQRDTSSLTTTTSTTTYQIVNCLSAGLINCPINLQNTTTYQAVVTSVLAVESGSTVTLPTNGVSALVTGIPFGSKSHRLDAISGTPTSYVPPPPPTSTSATASATSTGDPAGNGSGSSGKTSGPNDKLIIGLSVGLGVPFLAAVLAGLWYIIRHHRKYSEVAQKDNIAQSPNLREHDSPVSPDMTQKAPLVSVVQSS